MICESIPFHQACSCKACGNVFCITCSNKEFGTGFCISCSQKACGNAGVLRNRLGCWKIFLLLNINDWKGFQSTNKKFYLFCGTPTWLYISTFCWSFNYVIHESFQYLIFIFKLLNWSVDIQSEALISCSSDVTCD